MPSFTNKIFIKVSTLIIIVISSLIIGISSYKFAKSPCACGTVNESVISYLERLNTLIKQYASIHQGRLPTYDELLATVTEDWLKEKLTSQIEMETGMFMFTPTTDDATKIGYAVVPDQHNYVLIGIGKTEIYKVINFWGIEIHRQLIGYDYPILSPGDTPPSPSPYL